MNRGHETDIGTDISGLFKFSSKGSRVMFDLSHILLFIAFLVILQHTQIFQKLKKNCDIMAYFLISKLLTFKLIFQKALIPMFKPSFSIMNSFYEFPISAHKFNWLINITTFFYSLV